MKQLRLAPDWDIVEWLNSDTPLDLHSLRGRVVVAGAFQMLCPGCVAQTIPQLRQAHALFPASEVAIIGLHTVFEHHAAMGPAELKAFLHEYKVQFPVGVDRPSDHGDAIPSTMRRYGMQGTPTLLLIDREGRLRRQTFGHVPDLQLGAEIMALMREPSSVALQPVGAGDASMEKCDDTGCRIADAPVT
ncbi:redoxin family protein [Steroidobacter flavus]|uniref:Redoxin family protein n=1 Tax=Steroidobacter flavus TaxID=1842136 RepID=A0ABV8T507_9GAMM